MVTEDGFGVAGRSDLRRSDGFSLLDHHVATVETALTTHGVINVPGTAIGAYGDGGKLCFVVGATLGGAGLGLFSFRMCHCL